MAEPAPAADAATGARALAGLFTAAPGPADVLQARARQLDAGLAPAGAGDLWTDAARGLALVSRGGAPRASRDDAWVLAWDGALANGPELAAELRGTDAAPADTDDAAVVLAAVAAWGVEAALARLDGAFALALLDRRAQALWLARDPTGARPLHYAWAADGSVVFASRLQALWRHPDFSQGVDPEALALLLRFDVIPAPWSIHRDAWKLRAGHCLRLDAAAVARGPTGHDAVRAQRPFFDAAAQMRAALAAPFSGDLAAATERLDALLGDAVARRLRASAPVGLFLSGGTDSATVAALAQAQVQRAGGAPLPSFSIGFTNSHHDEAPLARAVARHLGTRHHELYLDDAAAQALVARLPELTDEPFADASLLPSAALAQLAAGEVGVALTGDGGDELFFGYRRYLRAQRNWRLLRRVPLALRRPLAAAARDEAARTGKLAALRVEIGARDIGDVYRSRLARWRAPTRAVPGARGVATLLDGGDLLPGAGAPAASMMLADFLFTLPDGGATKVERAVRAAGLEARMPLLDGAVRAFAWSLPLALKRGDGESKLVLRRVLGRYLPRELIDRPKRGFGAPMRAWLAGPLRPWAEALLGAEALAAGGFDPAPVRALWQRFTGGERRWHSHLWSVLVYQAWHAHWQAARRAQGKLPP